MQEKLKKVTFEFENKIKTLEGEALEEWEKACNGMAMTAHTHGVSLPDFKFKVFNKETK